MAKKQELVEFLDHRVFDPVLHASQDRYSGMQKDDLKYVQDKTRSEKEHYHSYGSADEVVRMYNDDLHSEHAKPVNNKLRELGMPRLADVKEEFDRRAA